MKTNRHTITTTVAALVLAAGAITATTFGAGGGAQAAAAPECSNAQLAASYRGGDGATSHVLGRIVLTNTSRRTCSVRGFGGLSYVGHGDGTQVGAAADRDRATKVTTVVLAPGQRARSSVSETTTGPYDAAQCTPVAVDGSRVYVPDSRASQFVAHPTSTCAQTSLHMLTHQAYRRP